ncbi:hypothetical protein PAXRUDRAFT_28559 [Paxillus rubicundulus Ve08.2h10]|uniref:Uncharacterized protein n=1 Tax=Paxillus rubicundulus Ve08.2h10 TaxID=930991 RepID=A0A0D0C6I3_9AGAM|nr:hypothetical protein PAXRUDRAFT_28559 [Paxillus rubicundulus Ve08.2h10]
MAQNLMGISVKSVEVSRNVQNLNSGSAVVFQPFTSTLQVLTVVMNWAMHGKIYVAKCREANTTPNHLAIPPTVTIGDDGSVTTISTGATQGTLEGFVQPTMKWSKEGMLEHIVEFVVREDQSFTVVDQSAFQALLKYQHLQMKVK